MSLAILPAPVITDTASETVHQTCCNEEVALCGEDVSGSPWDDDGDLTCVVCIDVAASSAPCRPDCSFAAGTKASTDEIATEQP